MSRLFHLIIILVFSISAFAEDRLMTSLEIAKSKFIDETKKNQNNFIKRLEEIIKNEAQKGDFNLIDKLVTEKKIFEQDNRKIPKSKEFESSVREYQRYNKKSEEDLLETFRLTIKEYTKNIQLEKARLVKNEMLDFSKRGIFSNSDKNSSVDKDKLTKNPEQKEMAAKKLSAIPFKEKKLNETQKAVAKSLQKDVEDKVDLGKGITLEMILIPPGKFNMGSSVLEKARPANEKQHEVSITKPYYLGKYEVTQDQWETLMLNNPSNFKGAKLPVTNVSWFDCQSFINKLNGKSGESYRLPTEAEWEYACRAGTTTTYYFGDTITKNDANINGSRPRIVGSYKPNDLGIYDMHGNVWEWCNDWYGDYPDGPSEDPKGPLTGQNRILRGGSFGDIWSNVRSSIRRSDSPPHWHPVYFGFRLARSVKIKNESLDNN